MPPLPRPASPRLTPSPPRLRRALLAALLATAVALVGCVEVERTVTNLDFLADEHGIVRRSIVWESNRYPPQQVEATDACWDAAAIGSPVPEVCLTSRVISSEADPYEDLPWVAFAGSMLAIAGLIWFALRRIAWQPSVASRSAAREEGRTFSPANARRLMKSVAEEKVAQDVATTERRDVRWPVLVGAAIVAVGLVPLSLILGYAAALAWAVHTGTLTFYGLAAGVIVVTVPLPPRPADPDAFISRLIFIAGATIVFTVGAFAAALLHTPMRELNGIAWLG